jgi:hypothetical protein
MRSRQLHDALEKLTKAIREVEAVVKTMRGEHDPLASHIFVSRRHYQNLSDTKSGKRREMNARLSFNTACELGFRGSLDEWERLMGAVARR